MCICCALQHLLLFAQSSTLLRELLAALVLACGSALISNHARLAGMNLIFSPVYQATTGAVDDAETDVEAAKDAADFGSVKSMQLDNNYHIRVLIPCYKEPYEIVLRTVNAIRDAVLPAGALPDPVSAVVRNGITCMMADKMRDVRRNHHSDVRAGKTCDVSCCSCDPQDAQRSVCHDAVQALPSTARLWQMSSSLLICRVPIVQAAGAPSTSATTARTARSGACVSAWAATAFMCPVSTPSPTGKPLARHRSRSHYKQQPAGACLVTCTVRRPA